VKINEGAALVGVEMARALCPVSNNNTGGHVHLRDTIRFEVDEQTGAATMIAGDPEQGVTYAVDVEFGHHTASGSFVPAQLFFSSGVEVARGEAKRLAEVTKPRG
jgi:hypothetical protein